MATPLKPTRYGALLEVDTKQGKQKIVFQLAAIPPNGNPNSTDQATWAWEAAIGSFGISAANAPQSKAGLANALRALAVEIDGIVLPPE